MFALKYGLVVSESYAKLSIWAILISKYKIYRIFIHETSTNVLLSIFYKEKM